MGQDTSASTQTSRAASSTEIAVLALTLVAVWVAYSPALGGGFIWDDNTYVRDNAVLRSLSGLWQIWRDPLATPQYHPLVFTSFWIEYQLWGANPIGYHVLNLLLHSLNVVLVWRLLRRLDVPAAELAAVLFALHPVQVESVAWISERKNVLSVALALSSTLAWMHFVEGGKRRDYMLTAGLFAGALLSKFVLAPLPFCMLLLAYWRRPHEWRRHVLAVAPLFLLALPLGMVAVWRERSYGHPPFDYSIIERILIAGHALVFYVAKLIWPYQLTAIYPKWEVDPSSLHAWLFPAFILGVTAIVWMRRRHWGWGPLIGWVWFLILLAPLIGFVDFNPMRMLFVFDHFQYLPSLGLFAVAGGALASVVGREATRVVAFILLPALALLTYGQAGVYRDAQTFWSDNVDKNPASWMGHSNLASALVTAGRVDDALPHFATAVALNPQFASVQNHWGIVLDALGRSDEALAHYEAALRIDPGLADVSNNLGVALTRLGRLQEAEARFAEAVRINPSYVTAHYHWGMVTAQLGKRDEAIMHFRKTLDLQPDHQGALSSLQRIGTE